MAFKQEVCLKEEGNLHYGLLAKLVTTKYFIYHDLKKISEKMGFGIIP